MALFDKRFTPCYPEDVEGLDPAAQMLYVWLCKYADHDGGGAWPSRKTLAAHLGVSVDTVDDRMGALAAAGVVTKVSQARDNGSQTSNGYQIHRRMGAVGSRQPAAPPAASQRPPQPPASGPHTKPNGPNPTELEKQVSIETTAQAPGDPGINGLVEFLKQGCQKKGWAYDKLDDRRFARHILTAKDFGAQAQLCGLTPMQYAAAIFRSSAAMDSQGNPVLPFWHGKVTGPAAIYKNHAKVYNDMKEAKARAVPQYRFDTL
jgi:hypothetical protein